KSSRQDPTITAQREWFSLNAVWPVTATFPSTRPPSDRRQRGEDNFRIADNAELTQRQGQAYIQRSQSPRFREESLHLGMRAAVDQVLYRSATRGSLIGAP